MAAAEWAMVMSNISKRKESWVEDLPLGVDRGAPKNVPQVIGCAAHWVIIDSICGPKINLCILSHDHPRKPFLIAICWKTLARTSVQLSVDAVKIVPCLPTAFVNSIHTRCNCEVDSTVTFPSCHLHRAGKRKPETRNGKETNSKTNHSTVVNTVSLEEQTAMLTPRDTLKSKKREESKKNWAKVDNYILIHYAWLPKVIVRVVASITKKNNSSLLEWAFNFCGSEVVMVRKSVTRVEISCFSFLPLRFSLLLALAGLSLALSILSGLTLALSTPSFSIDDVVAVVSVVAVLLPLPLPILPLPPLWLRP